MKEVNGTHGGGHWLTAAVVGAALGASVALLYAPSSGREARGWLAQKTRNAKDQTASAIEQSASAVRRVATKIGIGTEVGTNDRPGHDGTGATRPIF